MNMKHWLLLLVVFAVGYFIGIKFPMVGNKIVGAVPSVSP
jgi:hypothetical protein